MLLDESVLWLCVLLTVLGVKGSTIIIICENDKGVLECDCMHTIQVLSAVYGRTQPGEVHCNHDRISNTDCSNDVQEEVAEMCDGNSTCEIYASNNVYDDVCPGTYKYMEIEYDCIKPEGVDTPTIVCPDDVFECADVLINVAQITWRPAQVVDVWGRELETTETINNGSLLPTGEMSVNVTTKVNGCDAAASCSFDVTVEDCGSVSLCESNLTAECILQLAQETSVNAIYTEFDIANTAASVDIITQHSHEIAKTDPLEISHHHLKGIVASLNVEDSDDYSHLIAFNNISIYLGFNYTGRVTAVAVFWEYTFIRTPQLSENIERDVKYYLNSGLLSITTYSADGGEITPRVEYAIQILETDEMLIDSLTSMNFNLELVCGFIDLEIQEWSTTGCYIVDVNVTTAVCRCDHLTSFGVLMQVTSYEPDSEHTEALSSLTTIGLILSIVLLIVTEVVYMILKALWKSLRNNIHKNLIANMIAFYILFLLGIDKVENTKFCKAVAVTLHLLLMNIFFWMLGEAVFLVFKVIWTTPSPHNRLRNYMICCYLAPITIVIPAATFAYDFYGNNYCWLDANLNWIIVAPASIIILFSMTVLVVMVRIIYRRAGTNVQASESRKQEHKQLKKSLKGALFLIPVLGVTWIFGPLAVNEDTLFMQYIFVILNSLQGLTIFIVYCLLDNEVQTHWKKIMKKSQSRIHTSGNTQTTGTS